ncbi:EF-P lysine aminoacylase EpmA [Candidatus Gracilibacteria bacterium]|nr:EF-P lysine aminoacylase EpmA [Candidatus Gracilibacteria bacterium]
MIYEKQTAIERNALTKSLRSFFEKEKFLEVETPIMVKIPGMEPHLNVFETDFIVGNKKTKLFLNHSPELQMKKLLGANFGNIFTITKTFRNGEIGGDTHNPEFTMLEWYRVKADYKDLMKDCEKLVKTLAKKDQIIYQNHKIDLKTPWEKFSCEELFQKYCKISLDQNRTLKKFKKAAEEKNLDTKFCKDWDDIFFKIFLNNIEPHLGKGKPTFVYDYPSTQAALAKKCTKNPFFAQRFELYIGGIEIANAFSELTDEKEQKARLIEEQKIRKKLKKTIFDIDGEFLASLKSIQQNCAGIALGVDRLFMILMDKKKIDDVLLFPLNKILN